MKILMALNSFNPRKLRGTELYVLWLSKKLLSFGVEVEVIVPANELHFSSGFYEGIFIHRFGKKKYELTNKHRLLKVKPPNLLEFQNAVNNIKPDIFQLHSLSTLMNFFHLKIIKDNAINSIFNIHVPHTICPTGTKMLGPIVCEEAIGQKCINCVIETTPYNKIKKLIRLLYPLLNPLGMDNNLLGIIHLKRKSLSALNYYCDYLISPARWVSEELKRNSINPKIIHYINQGVNFSSKEKKSVINNASFKVGLLGSIHPLKGFVEVLKVF